MLWHEQSWPQIRAMDKDTPVVIPLASCEQHGTHMPLFVDTLQVAAIAERVEKQMQERILLLPTLWLGCSHHHMDYPGTVSVLPTPYGEMIKALARSVLKPGFRRIFFLNGHGGNVIPANNALTELADEDDEADAAHIALASWWGLAGKVMGAEQHGMATPKLTHACEYETSVMLSLRPDLVHQDAIREGEPRGENASKSSAKWGGVYTFPRFHRRTQSGHMGCPEEATGAKGESLLDAVVAQVVAFLDDFAQWPPTQKLQELEVSP